ncbi:MAG: hypothetical protein K2N68_00695 [Clostridia bacterium]|nr:hypothetical protein [Clostridia bacterium]MDE7214341.1 hypothetical protein [Clostridia bacterium]
MWNSEAPLKLLSEMPAQLNIENLKEIQQIIDVDKYENSHRLGRDLCGEYAPFCALCEKHVKYPCAVAYVKMKQAEGMELEIAATEEELSVEEENVAETPKKYIRIAIARRK